MADQNASSIDPVARWAERQNWIRPEIEETAQAAVHSAFELMGSAGDDARRFLQGEWLHEPLHAALTDIPVGAWTATTILDGAACLTGRKELDVAADATLWIGLAGAAGSAIAGLADWSDIDKPKPRRIGAVHALLNICATGLFTASCFARKRNETRANGRALAAIGYAIVALSAQSRRHTGVRAWHRYAPTRFRPAKLNRSTWCRSRSLAVRDLAIAVFPDPRLRA